MGSCPAAPRPFDPQVEPLLFIDAVNTLVVVPPTFPSQQNIDAPKPVADPGLSNIPYPLPDGSVFAPAGPVIPN